MAEWDAGQPLQHLGRPLCPRTGTDGSGRSDILRLVLIWLLLLSPTAAAAQLAAGPRSLAADDLRVVFWPGHEDLAQRTLTAARTPFRLPGIPAGVVTAEGTIYLAPSPAVFDSLTGGQVPEWGAGVAIPRLRIIILPTYPAAAPGTSDPAVTLRHELAHLALNAYLPEPIPRWFDEGYATWSSGGWDQASAWQIRLAFLMRRAPPLDSLELGWPRDAEQARLAYLLSASAVRFLAEQGGEAGFEALLAGWRREGSLDAALRGVYGMTPGQFEQAWRAMVRRRYGWLLALSQVTVFWVLVSVLLVFLFGVRRRRTRVRLAELEAEDRALPPADEYWMETESDPPGVDDGRREE